MPSRPRRSAPARRGGNPGGEGAKTSPLPASVAKSLLFSLQPWPVEISIGSCLLRIPAMPASEWVALLSSGEDILEEILGAVEDEDAVDDLIDAMLSGQVDAEDFARVAMETVTLVSGRPWWVTLGMIQVAVGAWDVIGGYVSLHNLRADQLSLQAWCDGLLATLMLHIPEDKRNSFLTRLKVPPPGWDVEQVIDTEREAAQFMVDLRNANR